MKSMKNIKRMNSIKSMKSMKPCNLLFLIENINPDFMRR